jgi:hypothetical protein
MKLQRRDFLRLSGGVVTGAAFGSLFRHELAAAAPALEPDPTGILDLPPGFQYRVLDRTGWAMDDGYKVPGKPDGMACFRNGAGDLILMRNHELDDDDWDVAPYKPGYHPPEAYNPSQPGGVSRLVIDPQTLEVRRRNLVLTGTSRNCAGGPSPWGWLTCEETTRSGHGYVFLCDTAADTVQAPRRLPAFGRFNHEAACVDPQTNITYLTEDRGDSCLYRLLPTNPEQPFKGRLQALASRSQPRLQTAAGMRLEEQFAAEWIDLDDPEAPRDDLRYQAQEQGAAIFRRGEGIWFGDGAVYVCSTSGGPLSRGQIFRVDDRQPGSTRVTLIAQAERSMEMDSPDNITIAPWGDLYLAEDGSGSQYLRCLNRQGELRPFARNALSTSEFAGVCFDPSGQVLFVNIQKDGLTLAITGPFQTFAS